MLWTNIHFVLLGVCIISSHQKVVRPRCHTDFHFNHLSNKSQTVYEKSWNRDCKEVLRHVCTRNITIAYFEMEPYTTQQIFTKSRWPHKGLLQQIVSVALAQCCGSCIKLHFNRVNDRSRLTDIATKEENDILLPVFMQGHKDEFNSTVRLTTSIIHIPAAMFITRSKVSAKIYAKEIVEAIVDIWPLLGTSLLLAFAAGVILWFIDTWWNKEHFPRQFLNGSFEGFWWAFISMTTVGYGDRAPKSVLGRLFAVFWILCGITITSLMTAALTTAIGVVTNRQIATINRGNVGVLKNHPFEKEVLMRGNAQIKYHNTIVELVNNFEEGNVDAMLIDTITAKSFKSDIIKQDYFYLDSVVQDIDQSYLGVTIFDEELHSLLHEYIEFQQDSIREFLYSVVKSFDEIQNKNIAANVIFTTESGIFWPTVYTCLIILGVTIMIGIAYEIWRRTKKNAKKLKHTNFQVTLKSLKEEERKFEEEIQTMLKRWDKHLLELMNGYSVRGIFIKTNKTYPNIMIKIAPGQSEVLSLPTLDDLDYKDQQPKKRVKKKKVKNGSPYKKLNNSEVTENEGLSENENEEEKKKKSKKPKVKKKSPVKKKKRVKKSQTSPEGNDIDNDKTKKRKQRQSTIELGERNNKEEIV